MADTSATLAANQDLAKRAADAYKELKGAAETAINEIISLADGYSDDLDQEPEEQTEPLPNPSTLTVPSWIAGSKDPGAAPKLAPFSATMQTYIDAAVDIAFARIDHLVGGIPTVSAPAISLPTLTIPLFVFNPDDYMSPEEIFKYRYQSNFFTFLEPKLVEYILYETTGIGQDIQDALFENMREHDLQVLNDSLDAVNRVQARRGFPLVTDMMLAARNDVIKKYDDTRYNRNREIVALIAERAQQNVHHAIDSGIKMEDINSRFMLEAKKMWFMVADILIKKWDTEVRTLLAEYTTRIDAELKEAGFILDADVKTGEFAIKGEEFRLDVFKANVSQNQTEAEVNIKAESLEIDADKANVDANVRVWSLMLDHTRIGTDIWRTTVETELRKASMEFQKDMTNEELYIKVLGLRVQRLQAYIEQEVKRISLIIEQIKAAAEMEINAAREKSSFYTGAVMGNLGQINAVNVAT